MASYFPFLPSPLIRRDVQASTLGLPLLCLLIPLSQIEQGLQDLNIIFCELASLLIPAYTNQHTDQSTSKRGNGNSLPIQISQVKDYVAGLLAGVSVSPHTVARHITAQDYVALLPTVWMLLNSNLEHHGVDEGASTLSALLDHSLQVSSAAATKRMTVDFFVRLILVRSLSAPLTPFHH
jgi:hypothetical protein